MADHPETDFGMILLTPTANRAFLRMLPRPDPVGPSRASVARMAAPGHGRLEPLARSAHFPRRADHSPGCGDGLALWHADPACDAEGHDAALSVRVTHSESGSPAERDFATHRPLVSIGTRM